MAKRPNMLSTITTGENLTKKQGSPLAYLQVGLHLVTSFFPQLAYLFSSLPNFDAAYLVSLQGRGSTDNLLWLNLTFGQGSPSLLPLGATR
jgi:hypothetical protein